MAFLFSLSPRINKFLTVKYMIDCSPGTVWWDWIIELNRKNTLGNTHSYPKCRNFPVPYEYETKLSDLRWKDTHVGKNDCVLVKMKTSITNEMSSGNLEEKLRDIVRKD